MYAKWVKWGNYEYFIFCCPNTSDSMLRSAAKGYDALRRNGQEVPVEFREVEN